ncbi:RNA polymerase sigma factor [Dyadobacter tibetensis]|uniref:RNA polymerase sigma factor n=1 Tax=Dyadobacter tibetensis TaxID=1211851 RepID=UPI00046F0D3F|nr:sigma-70 family RNA polymerase sigma factor [Dyadobacter tibetensis]
MKTVDSNRAIWMSFVEKGNPLAFQQLYDIYADFLYDFGMRYTADSELSRDAIHDLFLDLHTYQKNLAKDVNVNFYLIKSYKRKLIEIKRRSERFRLHSVVPSDLVLQSFCFSIEDQMIEDEEQRRRLQSLAEEVNRLPDRQREILYLRYTHSLEYEEIAAMMDISVATCRTFIYRALKLLRTNLEYSAILLLICDL